MTFIGIEFDNNDEDESIIGIAHSSWLSTDKKDVWWPPYKTGHRINTALIKAEIPNKEKWEFCSIRRIIFE